MKWVFRSPFRCPRKVIERARFRAPHMMWPDWAKEGQVETLEGWGAKQVPDFAAIICRNNAPLFRSPCRSYARAGACN